MSDVVVIGGGVIGTFVAYELVTQGAQVTLLESQTLGSAASYGNAGMIVPSYSVPMANPASIRMGLKALVHQEDAIKIGLRVDTAYWSWLARFMAASFGKRVSTSTAILCDLGSASMDLYHQLFARHPDESVGFKRRGWLYVYRSVKSFQEGIAQAQAVGKFGVSWEQLSAQEVLELEPALVPDLTGGVFYPGDGSLDPHRLVRFVGQLAQDLGANIKTGTTVKALKVKNGRVQAAVTGESDIGAAEFVLAAGVSSPVLLGELRPRLPLQPAKGYSLTFPRIPGSPMTPLNLADSHVVVSPLHQQIRLTGGLDLVGCDTSMQTRRLDGIWRAARSYLPGMALPVAPERWCGFRPMSPDGLPIIGTHATIQNLILATGHGTLGITLGPITGRLVAEFVATRSVSTRLQPLLPGRFKFRRPIERLACF